MCSTECTNKKAKNKENRTEFENLKLRKSMNKSKGKVTEENLIEKTIEHLKDIIKQCKKKSK